MLIRYLISAAGGLLALLASSAHAAYQYTYTSAPFYFVENAQNSGNFVPLTTADFMKIVITSDTLLNSTTDLAKDTSFVFTVGNNTNPVLPSNDLPPDRIFSDLSINTFDGNGLPTDWYFNYYEDHTISQNALERVAYFSDTNTATFSTTVYNPPQDYNAFAIGNAGHWEFSEISSPVPELPVHTMLLGGLGLIGLMKRRKS